MGVEIVRGSDGINVMLVPRMELPTSALFIWLYVSIWLSDNLSSVLLLSTSTIVAESFMMFYRRHVRLGETYINKLISHLKP